MKRILAMTMAIVMIASILPMSIFASEFDTSVTGDYFTVISEDRYSLAPGATEVELVLNNAAGNDRKVAHYFEVDPKNENIEVLPGYYGIDKLDPDNLALDGVEDKTKFWKAEQLTKTVAYYESLGYNVVGAMNTALAYDSDAPYGYMVMNGVVLGTPEVHKGAQTYLAIDTQGNCELRSMSTPLDGSEVTAISANFGWLVKNGELVNKKVERTSSDASRSMIGIKADGTLVFCQVDGRNDPFSTGLSNYEMGEMMLALGCVNAVNCDGGGSSTFVSKREGETSNTMRSIPSDGSERATINSVILVSKASATGEFDHAVLSTDYNYYAPGTSAVMNVQGVDASGSPAELPEEGITWALSDPSYGAVFDGVFTSNGKKGGVTVQMLYNGNIVAEKLVRIVDPDVFAFLLEETVLPYGKSMTLDFACTYGVDNWEVCIEGAYSLSLSNNNAAKLNGNVLLATDNESVKGVNVTATYLPFPSVTDVLKVTYGKGSEIIYDFENGTDSGFVGFDEAKQWCLDNGIVNSIVGSNPLDGQFSYETDGNTFVSTDIVRNGKYALGWNIDNTSANFAGWTYNVLFNIGETIVLRDVANGKNATTLGMWLYIPEGAAGIAFQSQFYEKLSGGGYLCQQDHFVFTTVSGVKKNLNSCTEADIPESRWVYATIDISKYNYLCTPIATNGSSYRFPSFIRTYVKPMEPAVHTFYIDDITLDYSSAVDDRVLPNISDISYTTQDESVILKEGAIVDGNNISFSAIVTDNIKLDYSTGKIFVDGNELPNISVSGKYLATASNIYLAPGVHTVSFEIKDTMGNLAKVTRTFTVAGDAKIILSGHNDSGAKPEYGSVYYIDIDVADVSTINKFTVSLLLQDANTWEPQGSTVADGFKYTYSFDKIESILTVNVERNGEKLNTEATTLVSIPVRLWTWNAINHITGKEITPQKQYASGNCPVVSVDCEVVKGLVNDADPFGGSISVETMINDTVNPWHYHDTELTVLNKDATCTVNGYSNRTYCETCKSVIDWGTAVEATGHNYVDGKCECGAVDTKTGLVEENGNWYYYINGIAASDWQMIGTDWYYFDTETKIGANGDVKVGVVTYNFVNGKLTSGVWAKTLYGYRYYYGPKYYGQGNGHGVWENIDGKDYFFEGNTGYRLENGWQLILENRINKNWYYFNEDGSCDKTIKPSDGFYIDRNGYAYAQNGQGLEGLQIIDGKSYYFDFKGYALKNGTYQGVLFMDDYAAYTGIVEIESQLCYYENGKPRAKGLIQLDGDYYFAHGTKGELVVNGKQYAWETNGLLPAATYEYGADGKMLDGIVNKDGILYYYETGRPRMAGLVEIDGDYYFASGANGELTVSKMTYVWETNGIELPNPNCEFGADGKMLDGIVNKNGTLYYYETGRPRMAGLVEIDGDYYFAGGANGEIVVNGKQYAWETNGLLPAATYEYGADGKMLDGIVEKNGKLYYYEQGRASAKGLVKVGDDYYFAAGVDGEVVVNKKQYAWETNGLLPAANYEFGADGKMLNGFITRDDGIYYYELGQYGKLGLNYIDGYYYFIDYAGKLVTNRKYYVWQTNGYSIEMNYTFDEFGRIIG